MSRLSDGEAALLFQLRAAGIPTPVAEYVFARPRLWRFDFAWPERRVAVEVEGGVWMKSGHHSIGKGFESDCEKYNTAAIAGWMVLRFTPGMITDGRALSVVEDALRRSTGDPSVQTTMELGG